MKKGATTNPAAKSAVLKIIALRNEKGSYNPAVGTFNLIFIIALRNEKGSYNINLLNIALSLIIALRNEKGSYLFLQKN